MAARTCLAIVLAAGEGTRMRSARPKVLHAIAGRSLLAHVAVRGRGGRRHGDGDRHRPRAGRCRGRGQTRSAKRGVFRAAKAARNRACGAGGESRDRAAAGRHSRRLRRHAADPGGDAQAAAGAARRGRSRGGARFSACRCCRLRTPRHCGRRAHRHSRGGRCELERTGDWPVQRRHDGAGREERPCHPGADRRPQSQR